MNAPDPLAVFTEWEQDRDGAWVRNAARAIVVDARGRTLLLEGFDVDEPERRWWFTPGGGLQPGEPERVAAARELFEESGLVVSADELVGPVAARTAEFTYFGRRCRQREVLYYAQVQEAPGVTTDGWTDVERASVTQARWWNVNELAASAAVVYPSALPQLVTQLRAEGWDGRTQVID
ncbi:NUDIX domain-containing protein [Phytoactinopolyspora alkaliphila]|uniref:NUDIX domain-containing protein n=1 Tax=Phytoactinopolyspora alkaliphila TaxID=1783498 RepID=A0A6N9YRM5_9ACTN|nr:NUDIX domain-containing protein [Phytoactinopolyspora alkaliphila]NED97590.1 NUDIX domain-containing protein [Phytoactinopolyspora alkaliphila]